MALHMVASLPAASPKCSFNRLQTTRCFSSLGSFKNVFSESRVQCVAVTKISDETVIRRSANYQPSIWGYDYVQSLRSRYVGESYVKRIKNLKVDVSFMLREDVDVDSLHKLELVDALERLGVSYHFEEEVGRILNGIYHKNGCKSCDDKQKQESLYSVALEFRLLRQHGYDIAAAETFSCFMDEKGKFKSYLGDDCKGILALYEAAYLSVDGESDIFHEAANFTTKYLKEYIKNNNDVYHSTLVNHALELPRHWRMPKLEARWFIDVYERAADVNPILLELAKLDFNIVQATHQEDLKHVSSWWRKTGLGETLDFARDRIVENFFWTVGEIFEPQFGYCRRMSTKINSLITVIDDVYDVHGTIDELELFTDAVDRWDVSAIDQLPYYMKMCFHVLHNSINDMAFDALKDQRVHVIPYLKKAWADMCKCFLSEAKWYNSGYIPAFQEYMDNAWISVSGPVILLHAYTFLANTATEEDFQILGEYPNIIRWSSTIFRLTNDLATSSDELKRGDVSTSIQCYMHETGACEREARERIRDLIAETWMKMNKIIIWKPRWSHNFIKFAMNLARIAQCTYQNGDGHTIQDKSKDRVLSLLIYPIALI